MKKRIKQVIDHPLISGGTAIFAGSILANILNYLFNLGMGRLLSPSDYGVLASLVSIINIFSVFALTVMTVFTKFTASFVGQGKEELIGVLFKKGTVLVGAVALLICIVIVIFSGQIAEFLHLKTIILINITAASLFFLFVASVAYGILQGLLKFVSFSIINIISSAVKLILGVGFVILGLKASGAVYALFLASVFGYFFIFPALYKFLIKAKNDNLKIPNLHRQLSSYAFPVFLANLGLILFTSVDIILVKHYFSETLAGQYAALNLMGRTINYALAPIISVFFPLIAQKKERKEKLRGTVLLAIFLIGAPSLFLSAIYFLFPEIILNIFFPAKEYAVLAPYLGPFSIFILFYSLSSLLNSFYLSIGKTGVFILPLIAAIVEIVYIIFFHQNIMQITTGLIIISFLLLISLLLYYFCTSCQWVSLRKFLPWKE